MWWNFNDVVISRTDGLPLNWKDVSPSGRVIVEIGFGNGEFLEYLGRSEPDAAVVGIEVSQCCVAKGARRLLSAGLKNVRIMHGDARFLLRHCFAPESVERVYMNFPCPWPKTRHAARRVTVPSFGRLLEYLLLPEGVFELATDVDWYAEETAGVFSSYGSFEVFPTILNPDRPYVTKYERKWKAMGKDTWLLTVKKNCRLMETPEKEDDWPMGFESEYVPDVKVFLKKLENNEGEGSGGTGRWVFRDSFVSEYGVGLILVITADEGFEQHFYIKAIPNGRGGVTVKMDSVGHPYRTPAVRGALLRALAAAEAEK